MCDVFKMSSAEKELQVQLKEAGNKLLNLPTSSVDDLLKHLDKLEQLLATVEQAPSTSMQDALLPSMKALIFNSLLRHTNLDVKVSIVSCITELTRITAPDAPYNDEQMKEVFQLTVAAFENLSHVSGRCYTKAVSILDNVARVRSCLVMLDLECDELIVQMFLHFLKTIRSNHPRAVFSSMVTIMTMVLDESEDISLSLLSPLLDSVRKENQEKCPTSWKLGENVLTNCAQKIKPYLLETVHSMGISLSKYSPVLASICGCEFSTLKHSETQHSVCNGESNKVSDSISKLVNVKGAEGPRNDDAVVNGNHLNTLEHCSYLEQSRTIDASGSYGRETVFIKAVKLEVEPHIAPRKRGRKPNSLMNPEEGYDHSWVCLDRKTSKKIRTRKPLEKGDVLVSSGYLDSKKASGDLDSKKTSGDRDFKKASGSLDSKKVSRDLYSKKVSRDLDSKQALGDLGSKKASGDLGSKKASGDLDSKKASSPLTHEEVTNSAGDGQRKRGRPKKKDHMTDEDPSSVSASKKDTTKTRNMEKDLQSEERGESNIHRRKRSRKIRPTEKEKEDLLTPGVHLGKESPNTSDIENKPLQQLSYKVCRRSDKQEKSFSQTTEKENSMSDDITLDKIFGAIEYKKIIFEPFTTASKGSTLDASPKTNLKRKRSAGKNEESRLPEIGEELIGKKIKVWWPLDKKFYEGVVDSYDYDKKKHRVLYADGDEEILNLKKQRWEFVEDNSPHGGQETDLPKAGASSEIGPKQKDNMESRLLSTGKRRKSSKKLGNGAKSVRVGEHPNDEAMDEALKSNRDNGSEKLGTKTESKGESGGDGQSDSLSLELKCCK